MSYGGLAALPCQLWQRQRIEACREGACVSRELPASIIQLIVCLPWLTRWPRSNLDLALLRHCRVQRTAP